MEGRHLLRSTLALLVFLLSPTNPVWAANAEVANFQAIEPGLSLSPFAISPASSMGFAVGSSVDFRAANDRILVNLLDVSFSVPYLTNKYDLLASGGMLVRIAGSVYLGARAGFSVVNSVEGHPRFLSGVVRAYTSARSLYFEAAAGVSEADSNYGRLSAGLMVF